jgi:hypothetical protein
MNNVMIGGIGALSLKQYVNQDVPKRNVNVKLLKSQVKVGRYFGDVRSVTIKKFPEYTYVQKKGSYGLYTSDSDGNPKNPTVFLLDYK